MKTFLNYARLQGITVDRSYEDFKVQKDEKDIIALTQAYVLSFYITHRPKELYL